MTSQNHQKPTMGTVQEYSVRPNHERPTGTDQEHDRMTEAQFTQRVHGGEKSRVRPINGVPQQPIMPSTTQERTLSVAIDAIALITTECITVTSAMRKHARWAHSSVSAILGGSPSFSRAPERETHPRSTGNTEAQHDAGSIGYGSATGDNLLASRWGLRGKKGRSMQDDPLIAAFARLRNDLRGCTGKVEGAASLSARTDWE